jgi:molecular chaperone DnaK (HSP70)
MSVVGIDFGNANNVVALARRKGIDVVLNDESKRETPSMLNFGEKQVRDLSEEGRGKRRALDVKRENAFMTTTHSR